jgi:hypothetical protein
MTRGSCANFESASLVIKESPVTAGLLSYISDFQLIAIPAKMAYIYVSQGNSLRRFRRFFYEGVR